MPLSQVWRKLRFSSAFALQQGPCPSFGAAGAGASGGSLRGGWAIKVFLMTCCISHRSWPVLTPRCWLEFQD